MTCYCPIQAWRIEGQTSLVFSPPRRGQYSLGALKVPCGQCIGCRLERSRQWAVRCVHEAQLHRDNCFITLTYDNAHLPSDGSLQLRDYQLFMKRLRKRFGDGIRFFHCGEYGELNKRPHYHAILFNHDFHDKVLFNQRDGVRLFTSSALEELWPLGFSTVGDVTFESAAYVARYVMKKVTGAAAVEHYSRWDLDTGEVLASLKPEYVTMSRRPGIAAGWISKYLGDVYPHDHVIVRGRPCRPPRYYDNYLASLPYDKSYMLDEVKYLRFLDAKKHLDDNSQSRLDVRRVVQEARLKKLPRPL